MPETDKATGDLTKRKSLRIKVISMGAAECGKSCLIKRYCEKRFVSKYMATLGIDFGVTAMSLPNGYDIKVNIFDMAGQPFFLEVRNEFYKDVQGVLLVYDVTNRSSFEALGDWLVEMRTHLPSPSDMDSIVIVVCANKTDLGKRRVDESEGRLWAETKGYHYFETSAQSGENVVKMFETLIQSIVSVLTDGSGGVQTELGYTHEQAALVTRIRACQDHYGILGVSRNCTKEEINKSYKQLAVLLHPDKNLAPGSDEAFKSLTRAREELLKYYR